MIEASTISLSESVQMYLVTIARLRVDGRPVPLSRLAETLSISPVSVNEMCRKLQEQGLVIYQPYKGASLTPEGERRAYRVLRRHRLWEVFLVEKLGFDYAQAHDAACRLEHATSDLLADRLDVFLEYPTVNPEGVPIPGTDGDLAECPSCSLATLSAGQRGHVVRCDVSGAVRVFLDEQGVCPGATLAVMATAEESLLVRVGETHVSLARTLAEAVWVEMETERVSSEAAAVAPIHSDLEEKQKDAGVQTR